MDGDVGLALVIPDALTAQAPLNPQDPPLGAALVGNLLRQSARTRLPPAVAVPTNPRYDLRDFTEGGGAPLWRDEAVPDDWPVLGIGFRPAASKGGPGAQDRGVGYLVGSIMTPAFLGVVGRTADITLVVFLLMQLALAFRVSQTVAAPPLVSA